MSQPNPTPPAVDVAEGRRLLEAMKAARETLHSTGQMIETFEACRADWEIWLFSNAESLLDQIATAAEQVAGLRRALEKADAAVNAAYAQADAEFRNHDTRAAQHDKLIREWRAEARSALGAAP